MTAAPVTLPAGPLAVTLYPPASLRNALIADLPWPPGPAHFHAHIAGGLRLPSPNGDLTLSPDFKVTLSTAAEARAALNLPLPSLPSDARCLILHAAYDSRGTPTGALALQPQTAAGDPTRPAPLTLLRPVAESAGARASLAAAFQSWVLPSHVSGIDDISPGTWLIAEVDGAIAVKLDVALGYNLNFLRRAALGELTGLLGLKLRAALSAPLSFHAAGRFVVILAREGDAERVRLTVLKERKKGWDFALQAAATFSPDLSSPGAAASLRDLVAAIAGTTPAQLIDDLQAVRHWTAPQLADKLAGFLLHLGRRTLNDTGLSPERLVQHAVQQVKAFLDPWDLLPHEAAATLASLENQLDQCALRRFRDWLDALALSPDPAAAIAGRLPMPGFLRSPDARWLESLAREGILSLLQSGQSRLAELQSAAAAARDLLDNGLLTALRWFAADRLNLDSLHSVADPKHLDPWLKAKLASLLERPIDASGLAAVRDCLNTLLHKAADIRAAAVKATSRLYNFSLAAGYQQAQARAALLDIEVDLSGRDSQTRDLVRAAIHGDFQRVLLDDNPRVRIHQAALTHNVKRQTWIEVSLPWTVHRRSHIAESLARLRAVDDGSRVFLYELHSSDQVMELHKGRGARDSRLAVALRLAAPHSAAAVRRFSPDCCTFSYTLRQATRNLRKSQARMQIGAYVDAYFPNAFTGCAKESLETWLDDLDRFIEEAEHNGAHNFGNALLELEVALPPALVSTWFHAPADKRSPVYRDMSRRLQRKLKDLIAGYWLRDPAVYSRDLLAVRPLLVYAAIPPSTAVRYRRDASAIEAIHDSTDLHWDVFDADLIRAMARSAPTRANLQSHLTRAAALLREIPELSRRAPFYEPTAANLSSIVETALRPISAADRRPAQLGALLRFERMAVQTARDAALAAAAFSQAAGRNRLNAALDQLERFGSKLTAAFHRDLAPLFGGGAFRALGAMLFLEAAMAFPGAPASAPHSAMLTLTVFSHGWTGFDPQALVEADPCSAPAPIVQERLVHLHA